MDRETTEIVLPKSKNKVFLIKDLLYGESVAINEELYKNMDISLSGQGEQQSIKASVIFDQNKKKFTTCVKKMIDESGKDIPINDESLNLLPLPDAEFVLSEIDKLINDTKKK